MRTLGFPHGVKGVRGAAEEEEVVARRLVAMKAAFRVQGDGITYMAKPGAKPMYLRCAPVTPSVLSKNGGRAVKHDWFHECPGFV